MSLPGHYPNKRMGQTMGIWIQFAILLAILGFYTALAAAILGHILTQLRPSRRQITKPSVSTGAEKRASEKASPGRSVSRPQIPAANSSPTAGAII